MHIKIVCAAGDRLMASPLLLMGSMMRAVEIRLVCPRLDNFYRGRLVPSRPASGFLGQVQQGLYTPCDLRHCIKEVHVKVAAR